MKIVPYTIELQKEWDDFVVKSKNGGIFHTQKFLSYHPKDRWVDKSILIYNNQKIIAVFPACEIDDKIVSHAGSSAGGLIVGKENRFELTCEIFDLISEYYSDYKFIEFKKHEYVFDKLPSQEVEFAAQKKGFELKYEELSTCVDLKNFEISTNRKDKIKRASGKFEFIFDDDNFEGFWNILKENLFHKHGVFPTHSLEELLVLKSMFKNDIILASAYDKDVVVGGVLLIKVTSKVLHVQYIAQKSIDGNSHSLSFVINKLIKYGIEQNYDFINFGISTTEEGENINEGLQKFKESFGGSGVVRKRYVKPMF